MFTVNHAARLFVASSSPLREIALVFCDGSARTYQSSVSSVFLASTMTYFLFFVCASGGEFDWAVSEVFL